MLVLTAASQLHSVKGSIAQRLGVWCSLLPGNWSPERKLCSENDFKKGTGT